MNLTRFFPAILLLASAIPIYGQAQSPSPSPTLTNTIKAPPGFEIATEMNALYGNYDRANGLSHIVESHSEDRSDTPQPITVNQKLDIRVLLLAAVPDSEDKQVLLATFAIPEGDDSNFTCHACAPGIGAALFERGVAGWMLKASQPPSLIFGEKGQPPSFMFGEEGDPGDASIVKFGPHQYGIKLEDSGTHGARDYTTTALFLPSGDKFRDAFSRLTMGDSSEGESCSSPRKSDDDRPVACYVYHSKLRFVPGKNLEYYDLLIETTGTRLEGSNVVSAKRTEHLHFVNGEYR